MIFNSSQKEITEEFEEMQLIFVFGAIETQGQRSYQQVGRPVVLKSKALLNSGIISWKLAMVTH